MDLYIRDLCAFEAIYIISYPKSFSNSPSTVRTTFILCAAAVAEVVCWFALLLCLLPPASSHTGTRIISNATYNIKRYSCTLTKKNHHKLSVLNEYGLRFVFSLFCVFKYVYACFCCCCCWFQPHRQSTEKQCENICQQWRNRKQLGVRNWIVHPKKKNHSKWARTLRDEAQRKRQKRERERPTTNKNEVHTHTSTLSTANRRKKWCYLYSWSMIHIYRRDVRGIKRRRLDRHWKRMEPTKSDIYISHYMYII